MVLLKLITQLPNTTRYLLPVLIGGLALFGYLIGSNGVEAADPPPTYHESHLKDQGLDCERCHTPNLTIAQDACQECHEAGEVEKLILAFRDQVAQLGLPLPPPDHLQDFHRSHGPSAQLDPQRCSRCHQESQCQDCHEGENLSGSLHPLNFRQTHGFEAQGQEQDCLVCHETRDYCVSCHQAERVLSHPLGAGWANSNGGAHGEEAEGNLESCLDCHDLGQSDPVCTRPGCHGSGGDE